MKFHTVLSKDPKNRGEGYDDKIKREMGELKYITED